ncbi:hypothetical protein ACIL2N_003357, partial [Vibrio metschnikovii]
LTRKLKTMANSKDDKLGSGNSSLNHATQRLLGFNKARFDNLEQFNQMVERSLKEPSDNSYKQHLLKAYGELYNHHTSFTKEERLIDRMERKAHIRNIFFRGVTTLVIGFSIMLVYWVAGCLGISMPLLRMPL